MPKIRETHSKQTTISLNGTELREAIGAYLKRVIPGSAHIEYYRAATANSSKYPEGLGIQWTDSHDEFPEGT